MKNKIAGIFPVVQMSGITWNIHEEAPAKYNFKFLPDYRFINPYKFSKAYKSLNLLRSSPNFINQSCQMYTTGIILEYIGLDEKPPFELIFEKLSLFLKYLRFESRQTSISPSAGISSIHFEKQLEKGLANDIKSISIMAMNPRNFHTMVKWSDVIKADYKLTKKTDLPVFEEMLLEAYASWGNQEYNKVLLFSTIAIESLLAHSYDKIYEQERSRSKPRSTLRMAKGAMGHTKDPIWKALMDRTDFKKLLHEAPLYLINKSILLENENLYRDLIKLYNTRNKIVHWGAPIAHSPDHLIELNSKGAFAALKMAIAIFNWIGINDYNFMLENKFVTLKDSEQIG